MTFLGMDTDAARACAKTLVNAGTTIEQLQHRLCESLTGFSWQGPGADDARARWNRDHAPALRATSRSLAELAQLLVAQAEEQDAGSADPGAGGGSAWGDTTGWQTEPHGQPVDRGSPGLLGQLWDAIRGRAVQRAEAALAGLHRLGDASLHLGRTLVDILAGKPVPVSAVLASALLVAGTGVGVELNQRTAGDLRVFGDGRPSIGAPVSVDPARTTSPTDTAALVHGVLDAYGAGSGEHSGVVRIVAIERSGAPTAYIALIPGTESWNPIAGHRPRDLTGNVAIVAGTAATATASVRMAIEAVVPPGSPVLLVGHSQGGMIGAELAADPAFRQRNSVDRVVTFGAPIDHIALAPEVRVLALQHASDVVPTLDLGGVRTDGSIAPHSGMRTVTLPDIAPSWNAAANHGTGGYETSVRQADGPDAAAIRAWEADPGAARFSVRPGDGSTVRAVDVPIIRIAEPRLVPARGR